jgi:hypothetical protein
MRSPQSRPRRGDVIAIVIVLTLLGVFVLAAAVTSNYGRRSNLGFGLDWECTSVGYGDPVSLKKPPAIPQRSSCRHLREILCTGSNRGGNETEWREKRYSPARRSLT